MPSTELASSRHGTLTATLFRTSRVSALSKRLDGSAHRHHLGRVEIELHVIAAAGFVGIARRSRWFNRHRVPDDCPEPCRPGRRFVFAMSPATLVGSAVGASIVSGDCSQILHAVSRVASAKPRSGHQTLIGNDAVDRAARIFRVCLPVQPENFRRRSRTAMSVDDMIAWCASLCSPPPSPPP